MWSIENLYFTSDTHFFHTRIVTLAHRPFNSVDEMNEVIIKNWNAKVPDRDSHVFILGDLSFGKPEQTIEVLNRLNGTIYLIKGNHDKHLTNKVLKCFAFSKDRYLLKASDGNRVVLDHFPLYTWEGAHRGSYHFHGHCHGTLGKEYTTRTDVGVDTNNYTPYSYTELINKLSKRKYKVVDHHG